MFYDEFLREFSFEPTPCQDNFFRGVSDFLSTDDGDIMVINGYAGTGKTSAVSAVINALTKRRFRCVLMAPTGRAAKVLSQISGRAPRPSIRASTVKRAWVTMVGANSRLRLTSSSTRSS